MPLHSEAATSTDCARHSQPPETITTIDVVRTYDRYAPVYDKIFGSVCSPGVREMARIVGDAAPARLLEVGVGTGLALPHYPPSALITGIDMSASMLDIARRRAANLSAHTIDLHLMDGESLTFEDDSFDCVTLPHVYSVTPNPSRLAAEVRRVCRPGGDILVLNHFSGAGVWRLFESALRSFAPKVGFRSDFSYATHIQSHDWSVVACKPVNLFGLSRLVHLRNP